MIAEITKIENWKFDDTLLNQNCVVSKYKTVRNLIKFKATLFAKGKSFRIRIWYDDKIFRTPDDVFYYDTKGEKIK